MRLRPLTEAECYARCYGWRSDEHVSFVRLVPRRGRRENGAGEKLRVSFERRLDAHGPEAEAA
jgi:hypothetical protein